MAISRLDIFNMALDQLPTRRIESLEDGFEAEAGALIDHALCTR